MKRHDATITSLFASLTYLTMTPGIDQALSSRTFQRRIEAELRARKIPFQRLYGTIEQRMAQVEAALHVS